MGNRVEFEITTSKTDNYEGDHPFCTQQNTYT